MRLTQRRFARALLFAFFVTSMCNAITLLVPLYTMELYTAVLNTRNAHTLFWLTLGLGFAMAIYFALDYVRATLHDAMADRAQRSLNLPTLLAAAQRADDSGRQLPAGQAMRDLAEIRGFVASSAAAIPLEIAWVPILLLVLLLMHWGFAVYAAACAVIMIVMTGLTEILTRRPLEQANEETSRSFGEIAAALRAAESVAGLGMLPALVRRWRRSQDVMLEKLWRATRTLKAFSAATRAGRLLMTAGMVALGLILTMKGGTSGGALVAANMILARLLAPFEHLVSWWRAWVSAGAAWRRLRGVLEETRNLRGVIALPCPHGRLVVDRLVYIPRGHDRPVLRGVSFEVAPGEILGVIGPSGAGKSTLARLVIGAIEPSAGGVYLDGNSTWHWERGDFGRHIGYVPQVPTMLDGSVADNIARLAQGQSRAIVTAARRAGIHRAIMALPHGYATPVTEAGFTLSGGQRQLVALARALYGEPKLLVLDEPNSNLDEAGERALLAAVDGARQAGAAVLIIAHRPSLIAIADRLLVVKEGMVDRFGARETVLRALQAPPVQLVRSEETRGGGAP